MIKKSVLLLLIIILTSFSVYAIDQPVNDYNSYSFIDYDVGIVGSFDLTPTSSNSKIGEVTSILTFFPRSDDLQEVKSLNFNSVPQASISNNSDEISYNWVSPQDNSFELSFDSNVRTNNRLIIVDDKINFPLSGVESFYTQPTEFIDINNDITLKASDIASGEDDLYVVSFKVADWIQDNIKYDLGSLTAEVVQKSSWVLKNKEGVCDELTNLFISMMRSLGVPARYVSGVAYTNAGYKFGPHAWAEVYFPDKGWVPFDVTYRQFGWVDPSHIKLKVSSDSGDPTIRYTWKSVDTSIKGKKIDIDTKVVNTGTIVKNPVIIAVKPLINSVGPGSFVPFEVSIKNPNNYYFPLSLAVTKANALTDKNSKEILLKPGESRKVFWISSIPGSIDNGYIYKSTFEVEDQFHNKYSTNITYSLGIESVSKDQADKMISSVKPSDNLSPLELDCSSTKFTFSYETPSVKCKVKNNSGRKLFNLDVCDSSVCKSMALDESEEKSVDIKLPLLKEGVNIIEITAKSDSFNVKESVRIEILSNPDLSISDIKYPREIPYGESFKFDVLLNVKVPVKDVHLFINDIEVFKIDFMDGSKKASMKFNSDDLYKKDNINLRIDFKDKNDKQYSIDKDYPVQVTNVPFLVRFFSIFS